MLCIQSSSRIYIVLPTIECYIVIPPEGNHTAIPSTQDCFIMHLFALFILLNVVPCKFYLSISFIYFTYRFALYVLLKDLPYGPRTFVLNTGQAPCQKL